MWKKRSSGGASVATEPGERAPLKVVTDDIRSVASTNAAPQDAKLLKSPSSPTSADTVSVTPSTAGRLKNSNIRSAYVWDVLIPPSLTSFQGHYLPKVLTNRNRERRLSVEIRAPSTLPSLPEDSSMIGASEQQGLSEFTIVRIFVPAASKEAKAIQDTAQAIVTTATTAAKIVKETSGHVYEVSKQAVDGLTMQQLRGPSADAENDEKSQSSISTIGFKSLDDDGKSVVSSASLFDKNRTSPRSLNDLISRSPNWIEKECISLDDIAVNKRVQNICIVTTVKEGKKNKTREIIFSNEREAKAFDKLIRKQKKEVANLLRKRLKDALGNGKISPMENVKILVDIVAAYDLPVGDLRSSDPYVLVRMGTREIHRTKHISKTLDPIWTVRTGSLFLIETTTKDLFRCFEGIRFEVWDYDAIGSGSLLGVASVPAKVVYEADSERLEFPLQTSQIAPSLEDGTTKAADSGGILVLRFRHATLDDLNFMAELDREEIQSNTFWSPKAVASNLMSLRSKVESGEKYFRVRPRPDPRRPSGETEWMTKEQIEQETFNKSHFWLEAGSGTLGNLYVEVLGCDDLPNKDTFAGIQAFGNKTDAFTVLIFQDALVQTDMISDCLSPRWLPWMNRAFIFRIMYPSAELFVGVFDYDGSDINDHDPCGRVSIDISKFVPKMEYVVTYNLYESKRDPTRKPQGTITLRIRVEFNEREMLLKSLEYPSEMLINCRRRKDWELARFTCEGKERLDQYSLTTITGYLNELQEYQVVTFYIQEALTNLLLWRINEEISIRIPFLSQAKPITIYIPLHSMLAFFIGVSIIEKPHLLPSFMMGCIGWMMLATMQFRLKHPSRWRSCKSFFDLFWALVTGNSCRQSRAIEAFEHENEAKAFDEFFSRRIEEATKAANERRLIQLKVQEEVTKEMNELNEAGKPSPFSLDPFRPHLFPIQMQLKFVCDSLLFARHIILWDNAYYSFWITIGSLVSAIAFLFIPWCFLVRWGTRVVTWALLGPWMKVFDTFYLRKEKDLTEEEQKSELEQIEENMRKTAMLTIKDARIKKEYEVKLVEMKKYRFGKFMIRIPLLKAERCLDYPLIRSYCYPLEEEKRSMGERAIEESGEERLRVPGQHLVGHMIPHSVRNSDVSLGQPDMKGFVENEAKNDCLAKDDSNSSAAIKMGAVILGALFITWFGVPIMISSVRSTLPAKNAQFALNSL